MATNSTAPAIDVPAPAPMPMSDSSVTVPVEVRAMDNSATAAPSMVRQGTATQVTRTGTAAAFAVDDFADERLAINEKLGRTTVVDQYGDREQIASLARPDKSVPAVIERQPTELARPRGRLSAFRAKIAPHKDLIAEFLGTMVLIIFGLGVVAVVVLSGGGNGNSNTIYWAWGWAVMMGILVSGGYSGAHLNPAVTISLFVWRGFPGKRVLPYIAMQLLGAFTGAAIVYLNYYPAFVYFNQTNNAGAFVVPGFEQTINGVTQKPTAGVFATYPAPFINNGNGFVSEMIGTALLLFVIFATGDAKNAAPTAYGALAVGALIMVLGMSWGWLTGYALNPARDFGPRCFSAIVYGPNVFKAYGYYFWVPIVGPIFGAVLGGGLYEVFLMSDADD